MNTSNIVEIEVAGKKFKGWTQVQVQRGIEQTTSQFSLSAALHPGDIVIRPQQICKIYINGTLVITGKVESATHEYTNDSGNVFTISGRSKTADLVDCSVTPPLQYNNTTLAKIVDALTTPYGIKTKIEGSDNKLHNIKLEADSEKVFTAIAKLAEKESMQVTDTPEGELRLVKTGQVKSRNTITNLNGKSSIIKSGKVSWNDSDRYKTITVKGQTQATDNNFGKSANSVKATATDNAITGRNLIIRADDQITTEQAQLIADTEIKIRRGKSIKLEYALYGWQDQEVWLDNTLVEVDDDVNGIMGEFLISDVTFSQSLSEGTLTSLTLYPAEAFTPKAETTFNKKGKSSVLDKG
jgi:prophage tail gpP-like protein